MAEFTSFVEIRATPERVFDFLITVEGLTAWMGERATIDPRVGGTFQVDIAGSPVRGEYVQVDRPHTVAVSWGFAGNDDLPPGASLVTFRLSPSSFGTRVDLVHSGLPDLGVPGHAYGWAHFLPRLALVGEGRTAPDDGWVPLGAGQP